MAQLYPKDTEPEKQGLQVEKPDQETGKMIGEEVLLQKIFAQNPQQGCEILFRKFYANLCNHAIRFVYAKDVAEEIVAEVFANFWQKRVFEYINSSYQAYLYKAVRYRAYNHLKFELNRTAPLEQYDYRVESSLSPDEMLHYHDLSNKVDSLIQQLPVQSRRAFQMHRIEGKKYTEIAAELNITVSAVERLISRALAKLRQDLKGDWLLALSILFNLF